LAGLFVFFTVILFLITLVMIGRGKDWFKRHTPYFTTFEESYNLQQGADVKLLETKIGRVQEISLLQDRVKVKLVVQEAYAPRIRMGSVAKVRSPAIVVTALITTGSVISAVEILMSLRFR